jgi:hypothetical protein
MPTLFITESTMASKEKSASVSTITRGRGGRGVHDNVEEARMSGDNDDNDGDDSLSEKEVSSEEKSTR